MANAYRSDVVGQRWLQEEIQSLGEALAVACPVTGCDCVYRVYDYLLGDTDRNKVFLENRLRLEHPEHFSEFIAIDIPPQRRV
jgi:hypothetical protein